MPTCHAQKSPSEDGSEEAGGGGTQDTGQGLGDVSRSPSCSSEILETRRLSREGDRGARAPGRKDSSCRTE